MVEKYTPRAVSSPVKKLNEVVHTQLKGLMEISKTAADL